MTLDCEGDVTIAGPLTQPESEPTTRTVDGSPALVHVERGTRATIEETGSATLLNGLRFVRLSTEFANVTDRRTIYAVLPTPGGENHGLFVSKAANGFTVRENGGGRSNIAFDYRVVGAALRERSPGVSTGGAASSREIKELRATVQRLRLRHAAATRL